jgi:predicted RNA-binding protein with RPS1 domain
VTRLERYGAFLDIGVGRDGMLHVKEMGRGYVEKPEDVVKVGDEIPVQVVGIDRRRGRVDLSMKELLPPAPEPAAPTAAGPVAREEAVVAAISDDDGFISPFELAFQEANQETDRRRERRKKSRPWEVDEDEEEDLILRTIAHHRKSKGL